MKYLVTAVIGFLFGAAMALGLLYVNPLAQRSGPAMTSADATFVYSSPITSGLAFTYSGLARLPTQPSEVPDLWEAAIDKSALSVILLNNPDGSPAAIASRVSYPDETTELLMRGALLNDDWLISMPGSGSLFVTSQANWWPFLKDNLIPVWYLRRKWRGPTAIEPTLGPSDLGLGLVTGATGAFVNRAGEAAERYDIREFDERVGLRSVDAELNVRWNEQ